MKVTATGNTVSNPGTLVFAKNGVQLNGGVTPGDTYQICLTLGGTGALANAITGTGTNGGADFQLRQRQFMIGVSAGVRGYARRQQRGRQFCPGEQRSRHHTERQCYQHLPDGRWLPRHLPVLREPAVRAEKR